MYWIAVILGFMAMRYSEVHGHWPLMKPKKKEPKSLDSGSSEGVVVENKEVKGGEKVVETARAMPTIEV